MSAIELIDTIIVEIPVSELPPYDADKLALVNEIERAAIERELPVAFFETLTDLLDLPIDELRTKARQAFSLCLNEKEKTS